MPAQDAFHFWAFSLALPLAEEARPLHPVRTTERALPAGAQYENSSEIGVFTRLTNSYCIMAEGGAGDRFLVCSHPSPLSAVLTRSLPIRAVPVDRG